jgi:ketosteroid isomerase-like protein
MSEEGMERIRLAIEAFNRRDVDAILRWNHPDVVYQTAIASMEAEGGVYRGHEGVRQWSRDLDGEVEDLHGELDELYDLGDGRYLGAGRFQGRGKGTGAEFDVPMAWVYITEDDELLLRYEAYSKGRRHWRRWDSTAGPKSQRGGGRPRNKVPL